MFKKFIIVLVGITITSTLLYGCGKKEDIEETTAKETVAEEQTTESEDISADLEENESMQETQQEEVDDKKYEYHQYETPTCTYIDENILREKTDLDDAAISFLPYFLDEYLYNNNYSGNVWTTQYIDGSYNESEKTKCIRITIDEIPALFITCGYSKAQRVWVFETYPIDYLPEDVSDYGFGANKESITYDDSIEIDHSQEAESAGVEIN